MTPAILPVIWSDNDLKSDNIYFFFQTDEYNCLLSLQVAAQRNPVSTSKFMAFDTIHQSILLYSIKTSSYLILTFHINETSGL